MQNERHYEYDDEPRRGDARSNSRRPESQSDNIRGDEVPPPEPPPSCQSGEISAEQQQLIDVFTAQLVACLQESSQGRAGLFSAPPDPAAAWPEAEQLRQLAAGIVAILGQNTARSPICEEFLDLCGIHGESHPGDRRLARAFLARIERNEVGTNAPPR